MYQAIRATSKTLQQYLDAELKRDRVLGPLYTGNSFVVSLRTPKEMEGSEQGISLWLYRVVRDDQRMNDPPVRIDPGHLKDPPLPLRLHYLVTPVTKLESDSDRETELDLLGKVMQLFHSKSRFSGADFYKELSGTGAELSVRLEPMALEEITRVWDALEGSYKLGVSYEVSLVNIDAANEPVNVSPVLTAKPRYGVIVEGIAP